MTKTFSGHRLRKKRMGEGLYQSQLGRLTGLSNLTISDYERGKYTPSADALGRLAGVLNCTIDDLFVETGGDANGLALGDRDVTRRA